MLGKLIGRIACYFSGHKRGKRVRAEENGQVKVFQCPRCGRETAYKAKQQGATA